MSRTYRIKVRESVSRVLRASDHVSTQLELLEILPAEQMAGLLGQELQKRGFEQQGGQLARVQDGVTVSVDVQSGTVTVQAGACTEVTVEGESESYAYDEDGAHAQRAKGALRDALQKNLQGQTRQQEAELQGQVTERLEAQLADLRRELDQVVNRVTAAALKQKAAQMGQIKQVTEDPQTGSMTIVLEV